MNFKLIIAIVLITILVAGGIAQEIWLEKTLDKLEEKILNIPPEQDGNYDFNKIGELYHWWKGKYGALELLLPHTLLYTIDSNFGELVGAVEAEDGKTAQALLKRILYDCRVLATASDIRVGNVF